MWLTFGIIEGTLASLSVAARWVGVAGMAGMRSMVSVVGMEGIAGRMSSVALQALPVSCVPSALLKPLRLHS